MLKAAAAVVQWLPGPRGSLAKKIRQIYFFPSHTSRLPAQPWACQSLRAGVASGCLGHVPAWKYGSDRSIFPRLTLLAWARSVMREKQICLIHIPKLAHGPGNHQPPSAVTTGFPAAALAGGGCEKEKNRSV